MKTPIIIAFILTFVLAQGLRLCVHSPDAHPDEAAPASLIHYESDSIEHDLDDGGHNFSMVWHLQGIDPLILLIGLTAFTLLLISLLRAGDGQRRFPIPPAAVPVLADGFRLRPPLRAPPSQILP